MNHIEIRHSSCPSKTAGTSLRYRGAHGLNGMDSFMDFFGIAVRSFSTVTRRQRFCDRDGLPSRQLQPKMLSLRTFLCGRRGEAGIFHTRLKLKNRNLFVPSIFQLIIP
jgi:hypothetical protein